MKIKRFFAPDIRQAIRMVREEQGPDAVILSNRSVDGGVEIVSAIDYDENAIHQQTERYGKSSDNAIVARFQSREKSAQTSQQAKQQAAHSSKRRSTVSESPQSSPSKHSSYRSKKKEKTDSSYQRGSKSSSKDTNFSQLAVGEMWRELRSLRHIMVNQLSELAWERMNRHHPEQVELLRRLIKLGIDARICREIADEIDYEAGTEQAWQFSLKTLAQRIPVIDESTLHYGGIVALLGPTGVGKTTTIAKLAARFCLRYGCRHVALVTTDCYRIGAHEQLHNYGRILDVPVRVANSADELHTILNGFSDKRLVLIDTAGMSHRDLRLTEQFHILTEGNTPVQSYLVISATTQRAGVEEIIPAYQGLSLEGCILTKIDETGSLGEVLSAVIQHQLAISFFTDGQRVPEDLHRARARTLLDRAISILQRNGRDADEEFLALAFGGLAVDAHVSVTI